MKKQKIYWTLGWGIPMGVLWASLMSLGSDRISFWGIVLPSIAVFCAAGYLMGWIMHKFAMAQRKKLKSVDGLFEGEKVLMEGPANHFVGWEGRGGWLTLTPTRLTFRSHGKNLRNQPVEISLDQIDSTTPSSTLGIIPNGLRVARVNGKAEKFVVTNRTMWRALIEDTTKISRAAR